MEVFKENVEQLSVALAKLTAENERQRLIIANMNQTDEALHDSVKNMPLFLSMVVNNRLRFHMY